MTLSEQVFGPTKGPRGPDRAEKGSAMRMIAEAHEHRLAKTERLKLLRLAREAEGLAAAPAPALAAKAAPKTRAKAGTRAGSAAKSKTAKRAAS